MDIEKLQRAKQLNEILTQIDILEAQLENSRQMLKDLNLADGEKEELLDLYNNVRALF